MNWSVFWGGFLGSASGLLLFLGGVTAAEKLHNKWKYRKRSKK